MKILLFGLGILASVASFAANDAQVLGAVFNDQKFVSLIGDSKIDDIKIVKTSKKLYEVTVNPRAPMVDGCSYSASILETTERFAINPLTSGIRTVLKVTKSKDYCPRRDF